jgi:23S rRNA-/tRNA-specific pseudouridylate synthase
LKIRNKDEINIIIKLEKLDNIKPEKMDLDIIFEDNSILIINKNS